MTTNGAVFQSSRPQDAIASILASMNTAPPVDHQVLSIQEPEIVPLNLATSPAHVAGIQHPVQQTQYRKLAPVINTGAGGLVTKKVIIATINGQQRILTPVSR